MTSHPEASAPCSGTGGGEALQPTHDQSGVDVLRAIVVDKGGEATQNAFVRTQIGAQPSSDAQVAVLFGKEAHRATSAIGQGWAMERNPSVSSFA